MILGNYTDHLEVARDCSANESVDLLFLASPFNRHASDITLFEFPNGYHSTATDKHLAT